MSHRSRGLHSRRGHSTVRQIVGNLVVTPREGSIDSLAPARSPFGLRLSVSAPAGRIPAGDKALRARGSANLRVVRHEGSIDSLAPARSPFGLRPCRTLPSGSIPAGDIQQNAIRWAIRGRFAVPNARASHSEAATDPGLTQGGTKLSSLPLHAVFLETTLAGGCASTTVSLFRDLKCTTPK
jgi:hypothetical protein